MTLPEFESITNDTVGGMRVMLYGDSNTGKTSLAISAWNHPDLRKVGIFNIDENLHTAVGLDNNEHVMKADVISCKQIEDVAKGDLAGKYPQYNTWVGDSLTRLIDYELREIAATEYAKNPGKRYTPDLNQYQDYMPLMARVNRMIDTMTKGGKHIIFTAELQDIDPDPMSVNDKIRTRLKERRAKMNEAMWKMVKYRFSNIWYINTLTNGDINLLVSPFVSGDGRSVYAKTKNKKFLDALMKLAREDANGIGLIKIASKTDPNFKQITFADIYNLWLESTGSIDG